MHKRIRTLFIILLLLSTAFISCAQKHPDIPELPYSLILQEIIDKELEANDGMGVSVAVIVPGFKIWCGVSGMSDPSTSERVQPDMHFGIASIGKTYVAALVLQLAEEGQLNLDDPINKWIPGLPNIDNSASFFLISLT